MGWSLSVQRILALTFGGGCEREAHGIYTNPCLDAVTFEILSTNSPAFQSGLALPGFGIDFTGTLRHPEKPCRGAVELVPDDGTMTAGDIRDKGGRLIRRKVQGRIQNLGYDGRNRLNRWDWDGSAGTSCTYDYDHAGRRILTHETVGGVTNVTRYVYDGADVCAEYEDSDNDGDVDRTRVYWLLPGMDRRIGFAETVGGTNTFYYYLTDHVGTVLQIVKEDGTVVNQYDYDAFGRVRWASASTFEGVENRYLFQGREWDKHGGFYYFRNRIYLPERGEFASPDMNLGRGILGELDGMATLTFCGGDPVNCVDPTGLAVGDEWDPRTTGTRIIGFGIGLWGQVEGCYQMGLHPIETVKGITSALAHPIQTYEAIKEMVDEELNKAGASTTEMLLLEGRITAEIATMFIGVGEVAALAKGGKIANALNKARLAARVSIAEKLSQSRALTTMANVTSKVVSGVDNQISAGVQLKPILSSVEEVSVAGSKYFLDNILGRRVFKNMEDFDGGIPNLIDKTRVHPEVLNRLDNGASNLDLMREGYAPIGRDGLPVNLHHIIGEEPGPMIELLTKKHEAYSYQLHNLIEDRTSFRRNAKLKYKYSKFQEQYWITRSKDFE